MPAKLHIESSAGQKEYWLEQLVIRVGSDVNCDLQIQGEKVASHALTLEYHNGSYRVHNRANEPMPLGTQVLAPGEACVWRPGDELHIDESTFMILKCDDDPSPALSVGHRSSSAVSDYSDSYDNDVEYAEVTDAVDTNLPEETAESAMDMTTIVQMVVIASCFVGVGIILFAKLSGTESSTSHELVPDVSVLVDVQSSTNRKGRLIRRLQEAELTYLRGRKELAQDRFAAIRDDLARSHQLYDHTSDVSEWDTKLRIFVQDRLSKLNQ